MLEVEALKSKIVYVDRRLKKDISSVLLEILKTEEQHSDELVDLTHI